MAINTQATFFAKSCGVARVAWNWALSEWKRQYEAGGKPNEAALRRQLNAIKTERFPWMAEVSKTAPQQAIKDLGQAFQHFFRRVRQGGKPGYPRFKKRCIHDSFRADNGPQAKGKNAAGRPHYAVRLWSGDRPRPQCSDQPEAICSTASSAGIYACGEQGAGAAASAAA